MDYNLFLLNFDPSPRLYLDCIEVYRSIKRNGWMGWEGWRQNHPIVIRDNFYVEHGQLRIMALIMLGEYKVYVGSPKVKSSNYNWLNLS